MSGRTLLYAIIAVFVVVAGGLVLAGTVGGLSSNYDSAPYAGQK